MNMIKSESKPLNLKDVAIHDEFWTPYIQLVKDVVIPYQWNVLNDKVEDAEPSHAIRNLRIAAGLEKGDFYGFFFQDTDLAKWLEAVAYSLMTTPNKELERLADDAIDLVGLAQQPDGYLNSYVTIKGNHRRWTNLEECHELYTAGHFIEAAVAYHQATGKTKLLEIVCKFADYIDTVFGPEPDKIHGYDGHQEIELALARLYRETGNEKYLTLSKYFIDERGKDPFFFEEEWEKRNHLSDYGFKESANPQTRRGYYQTHLPVRQQKEAVGHAVRLVYMLTGMADVAKECEDYELLKACQTLWENIVVKQMYITGGIGSCSQGEAFTFNFDLPNDTVYAETCASIGLIVFAYRMQQIENKSCYSDVIERELFNLIIGSMSRDGRHYFYVNPLEVWPEASVKNPIRHHVKPVRQKWFGCACCPPNLARLITSLGQYLYSQSEDTIYVHQYVSSDAKFNVAGAEIHLAQTSNYPWDGEIAFKVAASDATSFQVAVRIPNWCRKATVCVDGKEADLSACMKEGYAYVTLSGKKEYDVKLSLEMRVEVIQANPKVIADLGKVAIQRGPVVYCMEEVDNDDALFGLSMKKGTEFEVKMEDDLPTKAAVLYFDGYQYKSNDKWEETLYAPLEEEKTQVRIKAIPYCLWGNRKQGQMMVWMRIEQ